MTLAKSEQGSSLVEFAAILPFLLLIVFSPIDYAFFTWKAIQVQDAASAGGQTSKRQRKLERGHVDDEAVFYVVFEDALVSFVELAGGG